MGRQIRDHTEHHLLNAGDLVLTASGELCRVGKWRGWATRTTPNPAEETQLDHWSDEYSTWLRDDETIGDGVDEIFPIVVVDLAAPGGVPLSEDERRLLAVHARQESDRHEDPRYMDPDPAVRAERLRRWREIADWLHPDPWTPREPAPRFVLGAVEDGHVMAWRTVRREQVRRNVRVLRNVAGEMAVVECPSCEGPAIVEGEGYVNCGPCALELERLPAWRVLVVRVPES